MGILSVFGKNRSLAYELTQREVLGRYRGASFGLLWSLISPFLMLLVYTLAFGFVMKGRWPGSSGSTTDFALILFAGLTVHGFFAECFIRAPQLIVGNTGYVKRVVFPLDILVWSMTFSALFHLAGVVATAMLFLSSAIIPVESVPESYRIVFELNPLTFIINQVREVVIWGRLPDWTGLAIYTVIACAIAFIGHRIFTKLRVGFADVL